MVLIYFVGRDALIPPKRNDTHRTYGKTLNIKNRK